MTLKCEFKINPGGFVNYWKTVKIKKSGRFENLEIVNFRNTGGFSKDCVLKIVIIAEQNFWNYL